MFFRTAFLFLLAIIPACGGSGGGGSSPPGEIVYALAEDDTNANGSILENAISPSGQLYPGAPNPISTGGTYPVVFAIDKNTSFAFALNSNSQNDSNAKPGDIQPYNTSTAQSSTGMQAIGNPVPTGSNPTSMAIDPGGNYLVVADHGNGTSGGDVEVFKIGSNGALSGPTPVTLSSSSCPNPDKIVFPPSGSTGSSNDTFYVVCSSPELIANTSPPPTALYSCPISGTCTKITLSLPSGTSNAISNMEFSSSGTAFLPGETYTSSSSSYNAFLITCTGSPLSCQTATSITPLLGTAPAGDFAIDNTTQTAFIGNYSTNSGGSLTNQGIFFTCLSPYSSCTHTHYDSPSAGAPTFLATSPNQSNLYIVSTPDPLPTTTSSNFKTSTGYVYVCSLPSGSSCTQTGTTADYPVGMTFDPAGKFAFVPTWSGTVSIFQVGSNGQLTSAASPTINISGNMVLQVVVP